MSTRINVTVGDGGLLDRNAQQTAANRQARVLADQRATAEAEGVERRAADRIAAGLDPLTGLPASTPSSASTINRLDQEPAANRREGGVLLEPKSGFVDYGGTLSGLRSVARGKYKPSIFSRLRHEDTTIYPYGRNFAEMEFVPSGGPDGISNSLKCTTPIPFPEVPATPYGPPISFPADDVPTQTLYAGLFDPSTQQQALVYAAAGSYDTVLSWQSAFLGVLTDPSAPAEILGLDGNVQEAKAGVTAGSLNGCTHEFYAQYGNGTFGSFEFLSDTQPFGAGLSAAVIMDFEGIRLNTSVNQLARYTGKSYFVRITGDTEDKQVHLMAMDPNFTYTVSVTHSGGLTRGYTGTNDESAAQYDSRLPRPLEDATWVHIAVTRRKIPDSNLFAYEFFVNGVRVSENITTTEVWKSTYGNQPVSARLACNTLRTIKAPLGPYLPSIHGYRFTPKVLYTGDSFIPPPSITRLV
jgi:hypothetical protein